MSILACVVNNFSVLLLIQFQYFQKFDLNYHFRDCSLFASISYTHIKVVSVLSNTLLNNTT